MINDEKLRDGAEIPRVSAPSPLRHLVITEDNRLGGITRYLLLPAGEPLMQIPDEVLKCVAFLYSKDRDGVPSAIGTCFFLGYDLPDNLGTVSYAITARHVIKNADKEGCDGYCYFRLNKMGGGLEWISAAVFELGIS